MPLSEDLLRRLADKRRVMAVFLAVLSGEGDVGLDELRADYTRSLASFPVPSGVRFEDTYMGGVRAIRVIPPMAEPGRTLLYLHGGAYIVGAPEGYRSLGAAFAIATRSIVYLPDYRLLPDHVLPAPFDDGLVAYRWLLGQGHAARDIAIAGDAAGGAMTVTVMRMARDAGLPRPAGGVALSPWANLMHDGASMISRQARDLIHADAPQCWDVMARFVLAGDAPDGPDVSPVFADLHDLPPMLIQVGEAEQLMSDAVRLAGHLGDCGVGVTMEIWPEMFFGWHFYHAELPEAAEAIGHAARFLDMAFDQARAAA